MKPVLSMIAMLALSACAAGPPPAPIAASYLALGQEPGWTLEITPDRLNYSGDYGAVRLTEVHAGAVAQGAGRSFSGARIKVRINPGPCSDSMSDRRYAETVQLRVDSKMLQGCGGALLPPADLTGSLWRFTHIGGTPVEDQARTELRFAAGSLSGSAGCNRFSGSFALAGDTLTTSPLAVTKMACMGAAGTQEAALLALLAAPVQISYAADGSMTLSGSRGQKARLVLRP
jgi:heat shock protein HslJ